MSDLTLMSMKELAKVLGMSYSTLKRWKASGMLPAPFAVDGRRHYWTRPQILSWQAGTIRAHGGTIVDH